MKVSIVFCLLCISVYASNPPDPSKLAEMARYIINTVDWIAISTISTFPELETFPFANIKSVSDGPLGKGAGTPYLLLTDLDISAKDLLNDNRTTIVASLAEVDYCKNQTWDPQDPRCGRLMLVGRVSKLVNGSHEFQVAKEDLIIRHPVMKYWMENQTSHHFYIAKLNIEKILLLDSYGPVQTVSVDNYFKANNYSNSIESIKDESSDIVVEVKISKTGFKSKIDSAKSSCGFKL